MPRKSTASAFTVFGVQPPDSIYLPSLPYSVRWNCRDGGLFVGGSQAQHRLSNPDEKIDINIIKISKYFGSLGKTKNVLWLQLFYIASPTVDAKTLPVNTVCVSYLKKQSIAHLFNKVQQVIAQKEAAEGIFTLAFRQEAGELGAYYSIMFDWRERTSTAEKTQLEQIKTFMSTFGTQLIDIEGTRTMTCVDGYSAQQLQALIQQHQQLADYPQSAVNPKQLSAAS